MPPMFCAVRLDGAAGGGESFCTVPTGSETAAAGTGAHLTFEISEAGSSGAGAEGIGDLRFEISKGQADPVGRDLEALADLESGI